MNAGQTIASKACALSLAHNGLVCLQMWTARDTTTAYLSPEKVDELIAALKRQKEIAVHEAEKAT